MLKIGTIINSGQQIGLLGTGFSPQTDNERRNLHFGIAISNSIKGYVETKTDLHKNWVDPLSFFTENKSETIPLSR